MEGLLVPTQSQPRITQGSGPHSLLCSWHKSQTPRIGFRPGPCRRSNSLSRPGLLASSLARNTLSRLRVPAPHRDERCLRVVVAAGRKGPAPPAAQSGLGPRAPASDRDHQRLPMARARRATQPAMSPTSACLPADTGPDPRPGGVPPLPHTALRCAAPRPLGPPPRLVPPRKFLVPSGARLAEVPSESPDRTVS